MFFDVGFTEILFLAVAGLIILGPERLPAVARTLGGWVRRGRQMASDFQRELEREVDLSEIKALKDEVSQAAQPLKEAAKTLDEGHSMLKKPLSETARKLATAPKDIPDTLEHHEPMPSTEPSDNIDVNNDATADRSIDSTSPTTSDAAVVASAQDGVDRTADATGSEADDGISLPDTDVAQSPESAAVKPATSSD